MSNCGKQNVIQQGDQYAIPIKITQGELVINPENCTDVRIMIGDTMFSYSAGDLTYDYEENVWQFPITEDMSRRFGPYSSYQVGVKIGENAFYSAPQTIRFESSMIKDGWFE